MSDEEWPEGPVILGLDWDFSDRLVRAAAALAARLGLHLVCAFVDPASYLTEWEPDGALAAHSLDPAVNEEAQFPSRQLLRSLESALGPPGQRWSFRVLNGDVSKALGRLAESIGASLIIVGGPRPGVTAPDEPASGRFRLCIADSAPEASNTCHPPPRMTTKFRQTSDGASDHRRTAVEPEGDHEGAAPPLLLEPVRLPRTAPSVIRGTPNRRQG
jgi:Universal stress protein family